MPRTKKSKKSSKVAKGARRFKSSKSMYRGDQVNKGKHPYPFLASRTLSLSSTALRPCKGVPRRKPFELRYAVALPPAGLSVGAAGVAGPERLYQLNSLFAPEASGGHQPYYYDQIVNCGYERYRVESVSIKVRAANGSQTSVGLQVQIDGWNGASGALAGNTWGYCNERPGNWFVFPVSATSGEGDLVLENIPLHMIQGMTKQEWDQVADYSAVVTTSPNRIPYMRIAAINFDGSNSGTIYGTVEITYKGFFMDPQVVAQS